MLHDVRNAIIGFEMSVPLNWDSTSMTYYTSQWNARGKVMFAYNLIKLRCTHEQRGHLLISEHAFSPKPANCSELIPCSGH